MKNYYKHPNHHSANCQLPTTTRHQKIITEKGNPLRLSAKILYFKKAGNFHGLIGIRNLRDTKEVQVA